MKKILLALMLINSLAYAKDDTLEPQQVQAIQQQVVDQFNHDFKSLVEEHNNFVSANQQKSNLETCETNLHQQLKKDFSDYKWDSYKNLDLIHLSLNIQNKPTTLKDLSNTTDLTYYFSGKIFTLESSNEALLNDLAAQLFPSLPNTQMYKDKSLSNDKYIVEFIMNKSMSSQEYIQLNNLINQQYQVAQDCVKQYKNDAPNESAKKFTDSLMQFQRRYNSVFSDLMATHVLEQKIELPILNEQILYAISHHNRYDRFSSSIEVYKTDNGTHVVLSYYDALLLMGLEREFIEQDIYYGSYTRNIQDETKRAKEEVKSLF